MSTAPLAPPRPPRAPVKPPAFPTAPPESRAAAEPSAESAGLARLRRLAGSPFALGLLGGGLLWAALPPLGLAPLAFVAPIPWLVLARRDKLGGARGYAQFYAAMFLHWMAVVQFIRLPHWAGYIGWPLLAGYLALYPLAFLGLARIAAHRWKLPLAAAAPAIWVGLELARGHALSGLSLALLGHTQYRWPELIQIADLGGAYAVSAVVLAVAALLAELLPAAGRGRLTPARGLVPPLVAAGLLGAVLAYGAYRLAETPPRAGEPPLRAALIQGSIDTEFGGERDTPRVTFEQYRDLSREARARRSDWDVLLWPESMFTAPDLVGSGAPAGDDEAEYRHFFRRAARLAMGAENDDGSPRAAGLPLLAGAISYGFDGPPGEPPTNTYNSALLLTPEGEVAARYFKHHRVMFGEYLPLGDVFPILYRLTPMAGGLTPGDRPAAFVVAGRRLAPTICFESTVPHVVAEHVRELRRQGTPPDVLVNVTNDGWFWGSSMLDLHLACNVFRAVETRLPVLVAANTGLSAHIDGAGRLLQVGPRRETEVLEAEVRLDGRASPYLLWGDWPAAACLLFCGSLALSAVGPRLFRRRQRAIAATPG